MIGVCNILKCHCVQISVQVVPAKHRGASQGPVAAASHPEEDLRQGGGPETAGTHSMGHHILETGASSKEKALG